MVMACWGTFISIRIYTFNSPLAVKLLDASRKSMDQRPWKCVRGNANKTYKAKAERIQRGWGLGCVGNLGTRSRMQKQSDKYESCSRLAGRLVHLTCMVHYDVSFLYQKHSKIAQTN